MKGTDKDGTSFPVSLINPSTNLSSETALGIVNFTFKVSVPLAGTITLFLSQKAKMVYGVEIIEPAIVNAKENAKLNSVNNAEFFVGKSEEVIPELISKGIEADVIVVDPPRKGCDIKLLEAIGKTRPERVVYVSCDPSTLGRDLKILEEQGYKTIEVQPVDMFPQTAHIENVALLVKDC